MIYIIFINKICKNNNNNYNNYNNSNNNIIIAELIIVCGDLLITIQKKTL